MRCEPHCQAVRMVDLQLVLPSRKSLLSQILFVFLAHPVFVNVGIQRPLSSTPCLFLHISLTWTVSLTLGPSQNLFYFQLPIYFFPPIKYILLLINSAQSIDISWKRFRNSRTKVWACWGGGGRQINLWLLVCKYWVQEDTEAVVREYWEQMIMVQEFCTLLWYCSCVKARERHSQMCKCSNTYDILLPFLIKNKKYFVIPPHW